LINEESELDSVENDLDFLLREEKTWNLSLEKLKKAVERQKDFDHIFNSFEMFFRYC